MKRILIISPFVPYPPDRGHRVRIYYLLKQLCQSFEVALVTQCFNRREEEMAQALSDESTGVTSVVALRAPTHRSVLRRANAALVSRIGELLWRPREQYYHASATLQERVGHLLQQFKPDLVQVHYWFAFGAVPTSCTVPVWIDSMDVHGWRERSTAQTHHSWALRRWHMFRSALVERYEFAAYRSADRVIAVHDVEKQIVASRIGSERVVTVPIAVAVPPNPPKRFPDRVVAFLGAMDYAPNRDAVRFLIKAIMPRVREAVPTCTLKVVGGGGERWQQLFHEPWVQWMGHVASLEAAMQDVSVAVAPMRAGAGTNVKVLSLLSLGLPMVATNLAVEGLALVPGVHLLVGNDVGDISSRIVTLLTNRELASRLGTKGHELMWKNYHWENMSAKICDLYEEELAEEPLSKRETAIDKPD